MNGQSIKNKSGGQGRRKSTADKANGSPRAKKQTPALDGAFEHLPEGVIRLDRRGRIRHMNAAAISLLGEAEAGWTLEDWPEKFGLYLEESEARFPAEKLPPLQALRGEVALAHFLALRASFDISS